MGKRVYAKFRRVTHRHCSSHLAQTAHNKRVAGARIGRWYRKHAAERARREHQRQIQQQGFGYY